jgi:CHAD domain-containing protein
VARRAHFLPPSGAMNEIHDPDALPGDLRRILCAQVDCAIHALEGKRTADGDVHDARKAIKRARATLRLIRTGITEPAYRRENTALRDAARPLSAARDARILLDSLDRLEKLYGSAANQATPAQFRRVLKREQRNPGDRSTSLASIARKSRRALGVARPRIARMPIQGEGWPTIEASLRKTYRQARKTMRQAKAETSAETLHEWRKQTKYLWHQIQILEPLWPGVLGELADQAHKLADYLGDDHDLSILRTKVVTHADLFAGSGGPGALLALIDRCRARLEEKAFLVGERLLEEKPGRFGERITGYWRQWRRERMAAEAH